MALETISSCPDDGKLAVKVAAKMVSSVKPTSPSSIRESLVALFSENTIAKLIGTAEAYLENNVSHTSAFYFTSLINHSIPQNPRTKFPETVPSAGSESGKYQCRDAEFWTCGFFPGNLYCILERLRKYPGTTISNISDTPENSSNFQTCLITHLNDLCHEWAAPLYLMSGRTDTHDLGFIVQPALRRDWELFGNERSLNALLHAADSLASRYDERVQAIRSWDSFSNALHDFTRKKDPMADDFLVIIDSLCSE